MNDVQSIDLFVSKPFRSTTFHCVDLSQGEHKFINEIFRSIYYSIHMHVFTSQYPTILINMPVGEHQYKTPVVHNGISPC